MITVYDILKTHSSYKPISIVGQVNKGTVNLTVFYFLFIYNVCFDVILIYH